LCAIIHAQAGAVKPIIGAPLITKQRKDIDVEMEFVTGQGEADSYRFYLVDCTNNRQRIYEYRYVTGFTKPDRYCLDEKGRLIVLWRMAGGASVNLGCYKSPLEPQPLSFSEADYGNNWDSLMNSVRFMADLGQYTFRDGGHLVGQETINSLNAMKCETDENDQSVLQNCTKKLRQAIVEALNDRLLAWQDSLFELTDGHGGGRVFAGIKLRPQELALAMEVRVLQKQKKTGGEEYKKKLLTLNRELFTRLCECSGRPTSNTYKNYIREPAEWDILARQRLKAGPFGDNTPHEKINEISDFEAKVARILWNFADNNLEFDLTNPEQVVCGTPGGNSNVVLSRKTGEVISYVWPDNWTIEAPGG